MYKAKIILIIAILTIIVGETSLLSADYLAKRLPSPPKECFEMANEYDKWICFEPYLFAADDGTGNFSAELH